MRRPLAALAAVFVAWVGALIVSQYELIGWTGVMAGALFGVAVAEAVVLVARRADRVLQGVALAAASAGVVYAAWLFTGPPGGRAWRYVHGGGWLAAVAAPVATWLWLRGSASRGADSPPSP